jgi:hypothetical protein
VDLQLGVQGRSRGDGVDGDVQYVLCWGMNTEIIFVCMQLPDSGVKSFNSRRVIENERDGLLVGKTFLVHRIGCHILMTFIYCGGNYTIRHFAFIAIAPSCHCV